MSVETAAITRRHPILQRLKAETADVHARLDASLPLTGDRISRDGYVRSLAGLRDATRTIEDALRAHAADLARHGYVLDARSKVALLDEDLRWFGESTQVATLSGPTLSSVSAAFAAVYVVEGATLGGQFIVRQVVDALHLSPPNGCRFFTGHGAETGLMWRRTCASIVDFFQSAAMSDSGDEMVTAARATFAVFEAALASRLNAHA